MQKKIEKLCSEEINFINLQQAKQYLRIDHQYDDKMIEEMLQVALIAAENYLGIYLQITHWKMTIFDYLPISIKFPYGPIIKIEQFKLYKHNQEELNVDNYYFDSNHESIILEKSYHMKKAEILYQLGYEIIPSPIKQGILEHLAKLYDVRGGDVRIPLSAIAMYQSYKRVRL